MEHNDNFNPKKRLAIFIVIGVVFFSVVGFALLWFGGFFKDNLSPAVRENQVIIQNLKDYTKEQSDKDILQVIQYSLFTTIRYLIDDPKLIKSIDDAVVREGSFSSRYDESRRVYVVDFIVDIPSLRYSYKAQYEWSDKKDPIFDEWGTQVTCLPKSDLIYGSFNCWDVEDELAGTNDPAGQVLPYRPLSNKFFIRADINSQGKVEKINVDIYACRDIDVDPIEAEAKKWIVENIPDYSDYVYGYSYCKTPYE
ncbi:hypothetical protein IKF03_03605 [Candidatus Saccharibacteria bacterium]|nr:hypothetical protein [Candidatus Saccharibacteria bacterium]